MNFEIIKGSSEAFQTVRLLIKNKVFYEKCFEALSKIIFVKPLLNALVMSSENHDSEAFFIGEK